MTARAFLGAGDLYLARQVNGVFEDYSGPYECGKFEIKPNVSVLEQTSKGRSTYGQVIESVALQQPADLTIDLTEVNKESIAIALMGTTAAVSQAGGTLNNQPVVVKTDKWVSVGKHKLIDNTINVTNVAGSTTYVKGTDYIVNTELGWIKALAGGAITNNATVHVDATYDSSSGTEIKGATQAQLRVRVKLDGKNFADDQPCIVTCHEVVVAPDAAFDFLSDSFATVTLPGRMKTPVGFSEPFTVELRDA